MWVLGLTGAQDCLCFSQQPFLLRQEQSRSAQAASCLHTAQELALENRWPWGWLEAFLIKLNVWQMPVAPRWFLVFLSIGDRFVSNSEGENCHPSVPTLFSLSLMSVSAELKQITWVSATGLLMVVFGECLRKAAMFTAGSNFNHVVQSEKSDTHTLVTSGVYAWCRHPSYVGWFYWSIGTQV